MILITIQNKRTKRTSRTINEDSREDSSRKNALRRLKRNALSVHRNISRAYTRTHAHSTASLSRSEKINNQRHHYTRRLADAQTISLGDEDERAIHLTIAFAKSKARLQQQQPNTRPD